MCQYIMLYYIISYYMALGLARCTPRLGSRRPWPPRGRLFCLDPLLEVYIYIERERCNLYVCIYIYIYICIYVYITLYI